MAKCFYFITETFMKIKCRLVIYLRIRKYFPYLQKTFEEEQ